MDDFNSLPTVSADANHKHAVTKDCLKIESIIAYFRQDLDVDSRLLELELLLLAVAIGIQDAISFPDFHYFASNQTGNTVLFAVGLLLDHSDSNPKNSQEGPLFSVATIAVSLGFFVLGVLMTGQTANYLKTAQMRGWLVISNGLSSALVYVAAALQWHYSSLMGPDTALGRIVLGLLAFSSGSQVAVVRGLKITDITTAMATAAYINIFIDPKLFAELSANRGRNRRVLFLLMLVAGSFIGAGVGSSLNLAAAVLISAVIKTVVTLLLLFNKKANDQSIVKTSN